MSTWNDPATVAEVLAELEKFGADPSTTTIRVDGVEVTADGYAVAREQGAAVIDCWVSADPLDVVEEALLDDERYAAWHGEQSPRGPLASRRARERLVDYLREALGSAQ